MSDVGKRIRDTMQEKRLSFSDLSTMTGISKATIQRYASGKTDKIPADRLTKIAVALGTTSGVLLGNGMSEEIYESIAVQADRLTRCKRLLDVQMDVLENTDTDASDKARKIAEAVSEDLGETVAYFDSLLEKEAH